VPPYDATERVAALADEHLEHEERSRLQAALTETSALLTAAGEAPVLLTDALFHEDLTLVVLTPARLLGVRGQDCKISLDLRSDEIDAVSTCGRRSNSGLEIVTRTSTVELASVGDRRWAAELAEAILEFRDPSQDEDDEGDDAAPTDSEPDDPDVFLCEHCNAGYPPGFRDTSCLSCGGPLRDPSGRLVDSEYLAQIEEADAEDDDELRVLAPFETENPFLREVFARKDYGQVPARAADLLLLNSPDPDEHLLAAMRTKHGGYRRGYLLITTKCLRWVQTFPYRDSDHWPLEYSLEIQGGPLQGGLIYPAGGRQFQIRWGKAKAFGEIYRLVQQAEEWESSRAFEAAQQPSREARSLAEELERLSELYERGLLDDVEFRTAKARLLGGS
jgi:hypothetical protein